MDMKYNTSERRLQIKDKKIKCQTKSLMKSAYTTAKPFNGDFKICTGIKETTENILHDLDECKYDKPTFRRITCRSKI